MILLVEDEAIARHAFARILRFNGHEVVEAKDGIEALTLLDKYAIDLVITDLVMPGFDGFRVSHSHSSEMARHADSHHFGLHSPICGSGFGRSS